MKPGRVSLPFRDHSANRTRTIHFNVSGSGSGGSGSGSGATSRPRHHDIDVAQSSSPSPIAKRDVKPKIGVNGSGSGGGAFGATQASGSGSGSGGSTSRRSVRAALRRKQRSAAEEEELERIAGEQLSAFKRHVIQDKRSDDRDALPSSSPTPSMSMSSERATAAAGGGGRGAASISRTASNLTAASSPPASSPPTSPFLSVVNAARAVSKKRKAADASASGGAPLGSDSDEAATGRTHGSTRSHAAHRHRKRGHHHHGGFGSSLFSRDDESTSSPKKRRYASKSEESPTMLRERHRARAREAYYGEGDTYDDEGRRRDRRRRGERSPAPTAGGRRPFRRQRRRGPTFLDEDGDDTERVMSDDEDEDDDSDGHGVNGEDDDHMSMSQPLPPAAAAGRRKRQRVISAADREALQQKSGLDFLLAVSEQLKEKHPRRSPGSSPTSSSPHLSNKNAADSRRRSPRLRTRSPHSRSRAYSGGATLSRSNSRTGGGSGGNLQPSASLSSLSSVASTYFGGERDRDSNDTAGAGSYSQETYSSTRKRTRERERSSRASGSTSVPSTPPTPRRNLRRQSQRKRAAPSANSPYVFDTGQIVRDSIAAERREKQRLAAAAAAASAASQKRKKLSEVNDFESQSDHEDGDEDVGLSQASQISTSRMRGTPEEQAAHQKMVKAFAERMGSCTVKRTRRYQMFNGFYSAIDGAFFDENEFLDCFSDVDTLERATRKHWNKLRKMLGRARRLSRAFLLSEREKLHRYREAVRNSQNGEPVDDPGIPRMLPERIRNGSEVLVAHYPNATIHEAIVVEKESRTQYRVRYPQTTPADAASAADTSARSATPTPQTADSGEEFVVDDDLIMPFLNVAITPRLHERGDGGATVDADEPIPFPSTTHGDYLTVAAVAQLKERKELLLNHLKRMNNEVEDRMVALKAASMKTPPEDTPTSSPSSRSRSSSSAAAADAPVVDLPIDFRREYAYVVLAIDCTNRELEVRLGRLHDRLAETTTRRPLPPPSRSPEKPLSLELMDRCRSAAVVLVKRLDRIADEKEGLTPNAASKETGSGGSGSGATNAEEQPDDPTKKLIESFITLLLMVKNCASRSLFPHNFDTVLDSIELTSEENRGLLRRVATKIARMHETLAKDAVRAVRPHMHVIGTRRAFL